MTSLECSPGERKQTYGRVSGYLFPIHKQHIFFKLKRSDYVCVFFGILPLSLVADELHNFCLLRFCITKGVAGRWDRGSHTWISVHKGNSHMPESFEGQAVCIVSILFFLVPLVTYL